jgi:putative AlgH/UPF0301 family transcriptional regulator
VRLAYGYASRVVLIGCSAGSQSRYAAVTGHFDALCRLLVDGLRWGLDRDNCVVLLDPAGEDEVDLVLKTAGDGVGRGGLLLVYYAGPVALDRSDGLSLELPAARMAYARLRWRLRHNEASRRILILDCADATAGAAAIAEAAVVERANLLVQATPPGSPHQLSLTAGLIELLEGGLRHGPHLIDLQSAHRVLAERLGAAGAPVPVLRAYGPGESGVMVYNPALHRTGRIGQVLLAGASAARADVDRAVILILRYAKEEGAVGLILNRPGPDPAPELPPAWAGATPEPAVVFDGGPVPHEGYIPLALLRTGTEVPSRFQGVDGRLGILPLTGRPAGDAVERLRLFRGYLGWGPGELEADLADEVLVPVDAGPEVVFSNDPEELWHKLRTSA